VEDSLDDPLVQYPGLTYSNIGISSIPSTMDVLRQDRQCNTKTLGFLLTIGCQRLTGRYLPAELCRLIVDALEDAMEDAAEVVEVTREVAEQRRYELLRARDFEGTSMLDVSYVVCLLSLTSVDLIL
jgi:hypothetical protein